MNWTVYIFGSGLAFFLGVVCMLVGVAASLGRRHWCVLASTSLALVGLALALLSAAPMPTWFYGFIILLVVIWLLGIRIPARVSPKFKTSACAILAIALIAGALHESQYLFQPRIPQVTARQLILIGDSFAAGNDERFEDNWPQRIARSHNLQLLNYSRPGATVAIALRQVRGAPLGEGLVLLEIGGNDVLGSTSSESFERDLESLLRVVCLPGRQVVMFELPLPPLQNTFGQIQRRLAARHHVLLIPKRTMIDVLAERAATSDSIHLTPHGHRRMAESVWQVIGPAYDR